MDVPPMAEARLHGASEAHDAHADAVDLSRKYWDTWVVMRRSNLAQWKLQRLAHHHAYYALLDKTFERWKAVTLARRQRRQRVIATCRVGARFFQRLYWEEWMAFVAQRKSARAMACERLARVCEKVQMNVSFRRWRNVAQQQRTTRVTKRVDAAPASHAASSQLEVRGRGVRRSCASPHTKEPSAVEPPVTRPADLQPHRRKLARLVLYYTHRQYFQLWRRTAKALSKLLEKEMSASADRFRTQRAWRQWRQGFVARSRHQDAAERATFFLYYHLTKRSMDRLRRYARRRRQHHEVSVVLTNRVRRSRLEAAFSMWRQRFHVKLVFGEWRDVAQGRSLLQKERQDTDAVSEIVANLDGSRLLREFFVKWAHVLRRQRRSHALGRVVSGVVDRHTMAIAFRRWVKETNQHRGVETLTSVRKHNDLHMIWAAWSVVVDEKLRRRRLQRMATRFNYNRTLRKGFSSLQELRPRRKLIDGTVDEMINRRSKARVQHAIQQWKLWTVARHQKRTNIDLAGRHYAVTLMRTAFNSLRSALQESAEKEIRACEHAVELDRKRLHCAFDSWKSVYVSEIRRNEVLQRKLTAFIERKEVETKANCFATLDNYARSKASKRIANAQARGRHQHHLMRRTFDGWVSFAAHAKWDQIFRHRADQFRRTQLKKKCFSLWLQKSKLMKSTRANIRTALHHWKHVRERQVFDAWKRYITAKRVQREKMRAALELRHVAYLRDGLSNWISSATHVQHARTEQTMRVQTEYATRVWYKVREIAMHWRWLTLRRRAYSVKPVPSAPHPPEIVRQFAVDDRVHHHHTRRQPRSVREYGNRSAATSSALSEFVMLPRDRPRPRKPIDLMLGEHLEGGTSPPPSPIVVDVPSTLQHVNHKYGFQFPIPQQALLSDDKQSKLPTITPTHDDLVLLSQVEGQDSLNQLEQRLLYWEERRQKLKRLQQSLADFRALLHQAAFEGNLSTDDLEHLRSRLTAMEEQEVLSRRRWNESRGEIRHLASQIKSLQAAAASPA